MLNIKVTGLKDLEKALNPNLVRKATTWALNRTAKNALTAAYKKIREVNAIKQKDLAKAVKVKKATPTNQMVTILIKGSRIPLISYGAKQTKKGITFRVKKKEKRKLIPHAFKATTRFSEGAFLREGKQAYPIRELKGMSVAEMFEVTEVIDVINDRVDEMFPKNFDRRYGFLVDKAVGV